MMREDGVNLFYDGKVYDTRDTVTNTVRRSFDLGVRFITVHSTPSVMEAAMRAKPADERCKVLAVTHLTDDGTPYSSSKLRYALSICDGVVGSYVIARYVRQWLDEKSPTIISPGIRLPDKYGQIEKTRDNHDLSHVATASEALQAGADYLVVGRAITQAPDLIAAARAIISEMESAHLRAPENADWTTDTAGKCCR
jgi:orotidine-5'-phosphate decarboxylase